MPLITLNTWPTMSMEEKKKYIYKVTELTAKELQMIPDKIQVLIQESEKENWGKAGAAAIEADFAYKSRITDWSTKDSYGSKDSHIEGMSIITIDIWNTFNQETKNRWVARLTELTSQLTHAPSDKVLIVIREMIPGNWGQSGVTGADSDFLTKSRIL
jgi:4-oxalocrotonate tautomerase